MKAQLRLLFIALFVALVMALPAQAQTATDAQANATSLSTLPEAEIIVYVNAPRIINDALPRLLPDKDYQEFRKGLEQVKAFTNIDLRNMEFIVWALRFNKPSEGKILPLPEVMFATRGDFDAQALIGMATMMSEGKLREDKYGSHTIHILKLEDVAKGATTNPFGAAFSEIAIAALDPHTLAIGNTGYIRAAFDAADGRGRINPETVASLMRAPDALISSAGSPLTAFAKSFGLRMAENRANNCDCATRFGDFYGSLNMDAQNFKITSAMHADNPDTAMIFKNMMSGLFQQSRGYVPDKSAQTMLDLVKIMAEGNEVMVEATIPQEMAAKFVREMMAPKPLPKVVATEAKTETAPTVVETKTAAPKPKSKKTRRKN